LARGLHAAIVTRTLRQRLNPDAPLIDKRPEFASPAWLLEHLGVRQGAVSLIVLVMTRSTEWNPTSIPASWNAETIQRHPRYGMRHFVNVTGHRARVIDV
jgi:hypothetical protein